MARELSREAVRYQAEAFIAWSCKAGNDEAGAFRRWAESKDFSLEDLRAIVEAVRKFRVAPSPAETDAS